MYVANRASDKITQLTDNVYVCRSGSVIISLRDFIIVFVWPVLWKLYTLLDFVLNLFCLLGFLLGCLLFLFYLQFGYSDVFYWLQQALLASFAGCWFSGCLWLRPLLPSPAYVSVLIRRKYMTWYLCYLIYPINNDLFYYDLQNSARTTCNCKGFCQPY